MKQVEIERLLQWTFCDQKSEYSVPGLGYQNSWAIIERHLRLGCNIDCSARGNGLGEVFAFPDSDALVVAREVDELNSNVVYRLESVKRIAPRQSGRPSSTRAASLVFDEIALVIGHAYTGILPELECGRPKLRPRILGNGKPAVSGTRYGKDRYSAGAHCPLEWVQPTIEGVALARATYAVWHSAADTSCTRTQGKLRNISAVPPSSSAAPWSTAVPPIR